MYFVIYVFWESNNVVQETCSHGTLYVFCYLCFLLEAYAPPIYLLYITVELLYCRHHGTIAACLDYRGIRISEASSIIPVGVAMHTRAVECYEDTFYSSPLLYACEKGWPKARTMRTSAIIMSSCWIDQQWWTNLRERQGRKEGEPIQERAGQGDS